MHFLPCAFTDLLVPARAIHCRGGKNTLVIHNTCEDSLLAAPIILDLVLLAEMLTRIEVRSQ